MPTTTFLLYLDDQFSRVYKKAIRSKIETEFPIRFLSEAKEAADEMEARRTIVDAVGYIRDKVRAGHMVLKHNIQYGFWRNLIGGSVIGFLVSLINVFIFKYLQPQAVAFWMSIFLAVVYAALLLSSKWAIGYLGRLYAIRLYAEYMSSSQA